jgi:hypothetical protein
VRALASILAVCVLTLAAVSAAGAAKKPGFTGNVCKLAPAANVKAVVGSPSTCKSQRQSGIGSINYVGNWSTAKARSATLQVTVEKFTDSGMQKLAITNLKQGLPGPPKRIGKIGSTVAFEGTGANATGIHFAAGKYVVILVVNTVGSNPPKKLRTALENLAKAIAPKL